MLIFQSLLFLQIIDENFLNCQLLWRFAKQIASVYKESQLCFTCQMKSGFKRALYLNLLLIRKILSTRHSIKTSIYNCATPLQFFLQEQLSMNNEAQIAKNRSQNLIPASFPNTVSFGRSCCTNIFRDN